jgi:hypothetical protein
VSDQRRSWAGIAEPDHIREGGVRIIDDDVHVVVYRSGEVEVGSLRSAAR